MKKIFCAILLLTVVGCDSKPERTAESTNSEVKVSVITRFEGITLYRVEADGKNIYVAKEGKVPLNLEAKWDTTECHSCGKNCTTCNTVHHSEETLAALRIEKE